MPTRVRSYSKINLGLAIGPTRADGFHGLTTVYQTLALHDLVTVTARRAPTTTITLTADNQWVPRTLAGNAAKNTAWKMVAAALDRLGLTAEVHIDIQKRLPVQGGMGAGSANASAALIGLEHELNQQLPSAERLKLAAEIGSDVPLFLIGGTVLGTGRGEQVSPLPDLPPTPCVIALPKVGVSTPQAFRDLDLKMAAAQGLTSDASVDKLEQLSRVLAAVFSNMMTTGSEPGPSGISCTARPSESFGTSSQESSFQCDHGTAIDLAENTLLALVRTGIENDFEEVAFSQHPFLRDIKRQLMGRDSDSPALYAALSGSGSALFGLYKSEADAVAAQHRVQSTGTQAILTETLPRPEYWKQMFAE
ncbi:MAG: 4-(cytidine 5'-diphospho)-2-C-methyl-D-erythritol kinase [Acidobacteriaceae bacterium]